jgi:hypothetical protein
MLSKKHKKIAHIIHPVMVSTGSDLVVAQPITFETMKIAREFARDEEDIGLYAIQYYDEKRVSLPVCFNRVPDLTRSITDIKTFKQRRKLALIKDILDALYKAAGNAEYMIYTNVDIALQPYFYQAVNEIIDQGYDAFVINRRTISQRYTTVGEIPLMYAEFGEPHPGYDCFIFRRDLYKRFKLGTICIGTAWVGRTMLANMVAYSNRFKEFREVHLTFHIGDSQHWRNCEYQDYFLENKNQYMEIFNLLEEERGRFGTILRSYLLDTVPKRKFPDFD